jgi:hypothetical protein
MPKQIDPEFLKQEYFHLQKTIEDFDQKSLTIKAWSVTLSMAGIGAAFSQKVPVILLLAAGSALLFWIIEAFWKSFQLAYLYRIRAIEAYTRGENSNDFTVPDITRTWGIGWRKYSVKTILWWPHVCLPHIVIVVSGPILWAVNLFSKFIPSAP